MQGFPAEELRCQALKYQILLNQTELSRLERYADLLVEWNQRMNLTAITDPEEIAFKHFLDSLLLLNACTIPTAAKMIDVGAGAGFPSVPCAIVRGDIRLTLLDSLKKRLAFLDEVCASIGLSADRIHARAEDGGHKPGLREGFDLATARAVAHLRELAEYCLPFVAIGGLFVALKGAKLEEELKDSGRAIQLLGGELEQVKSYSLPDGSRRFLVLIRKKSQTPAKYPRSASKIAKNPLHN